MCSLGWSWDSIFSCPEDEDVVTAVSWFWSPRLGRAQRSPQKAMPVMVDQGNIFKTVMAHKHPSVLYPNRVAISNKGMKLTVLQRGLLILYLGSLLSPVPSQIQELVLTEQLHLYSWGRS